MPTYPQLRDKAWLVERYVEQGLSSIQVAEEIGCTPGAVQYAMRRFGMKARGRHYEHWKDKTCERCGEAFTPSGPAQRFCSERCRFGRHGKGVAYRCADCGSMHIVPVPIHE